MIAFPIAVLSCFGLAQRLIGSERKNTSFTLAVAAAFFCLTFSTICTTLALCNLLTERFLWPTTAVLIFASMIYGRKRFQRLFDLDAVLILIATIPYFLMAMVPIWYRDSLTYHASMAKLYANTGGFDHGDLIVFSFFPQSWHSFLAGWMVLFPDGHFRFLGPWMALFCLWAVFGIARQMHASRGQAALATALIWLMPTFMEFGTSLYVQNALILFATLAFYWAANENKRVIILSGICAGFCASLKLSGLYILLLIALWRLWKRSFLAEFVISAAMFAAPFYIRNFIDTGNPFFPMMWSLFGGAGWDEWRAMAYEETLRGYGAGRDLIDFMLLPLRVFLTRDLIQQFQGSIGPVVLALIGWGAYKNKDPFWRFVLPAWGLIWAFNVQQIRFLMPIVPAALAVNMHLGPQKKHWIALPLLLGAIWSFEPTMHLWNRQATSEILSQRMTKDDFLRQKLPENYPVTEWLNQQAHRKVWLVWMRGYHYYLDKPARIDNVFGAWRFEALLEEVQSPQEFKNRLRADGIDAVVINHRFFLQDDNADTREGRTEELRRRFQGILDAAALNVAYSNGPITVYSLSESESSLRESSN